MRSVLPVLGPGSLKVVGVLLPLSLLLPFGPGLAAAQDRARAVQVETGVSLPRVTVGEPFRVTIRLRTPPGAQAEFGALPTTDSIQALAPPRPVDDAAGPAAIYDLVAWAPGPFSANQAVVPVRLSTAVGDGAVQLIRLPLPEVASVLPAEGPIEPRPARGLLEVSPGPAEVAWWVWVLALLGALLAAAVGLRALLRRPPPLASTTPGEWALHQLDHLGDARSLAEAAVKVGGAADILRTYLSRVDEGLGCDLTTPELVLAVRARAAFSGAADELERILSTADQVKFAKGMVGDEQGNSMIESVRGWILRYPLDSGSTAKAA